MIFTGKVTIFHVELLIPQIPVIFTEIPISLTVLAPSFCPLFPILRNVLCGVKLPTKTTLSSKSVSSKLLVTIFHLESLNFPNPFYLDGYAHKYNNPPTFFIPLPLLSLKLRNELCSFELPAKAVPTETV